MFQKLIPVNAERHAKLKVKQVEGFAFANGFHIASVMLHEFVKAAAIYPIVFLEDKQKDEFKPVALLGLDTNENLFVGADGKWQASYVPAIIRRYPFALAGSGQDGRYTVCIDEGSDMVSENEGSALFDEKGEATQVIENVKRYLGELQQMDVITQGFCKFLAENNMLTPLNMRVRDHDRIRNITGCYVINEERLNNLSDERFLEIRGKHYLPGIYAQLVSLAQIDRLVLLKDARTEVAAKEIAENPVVTH
jgi:hypothetical protein